MNQPLKLVLAMAIGFVAGAVIGWNEHRDHHAELRHLSSWMSHILQDRDELERENQRLRQSSAAE